MSTKIFYTSTRRCGNIAHAKLSVGNYPQLELKDLFRGTIVEIRNIKDQPNQKPEDQQWSLMENLICESVDKGRNQEAAASDKQTVTPEIVPFA